jgi:hypothetical protein
MSRTSLAALLALPALLACAGSSPAVQGPTVASVAVQQGDLPGGMIRCDLSGDIDSFLDKEKTADASTYQSTKKEWDEAKTKGATAAHVALYSDNAAHCASIKSSGADIGAATYKLVINFVIQFKDEASAAKGYTSEKIFNFSAADLRTSGQKVVEGTKNGLSANSVVLDTLIGGQTYYIAVWQRKAFMVILAVLNIDSAAAKKIAAAEDGRIK